MVGVRPHISVPLGSRRRRWIVDGTLDRRIPRKYVLRFEWLSHDLAAVGVIWKERIAAGGWASKNPETPLHAKRRWRWKRGNARQVKTRPRRSALISDIVSTPSTSSRCLFALRRWPYSRPVHIILFSVCNLLGCFPEFLIRVGFRDSGQPTTTVLSTVLLHG